MEIPLVLFIAAVIAALAYRGEWLRERRNNPTNMQNYDWSAKELDNNPDRNNITAQVEGTEVDSGEEKKDDEIKKEDLVVDAVGMKYMMGGKEHVFNGYKFVPTGRTETTNPETEELKAKGKGVVFTLNGVDHSFDGKNFTPIKK